MVYLYGSEGYGEDSDMGDGAKVGSGIKALHRWVLHKDREKS